MIRTLVTASLALALVSCSAGDEHGSISLEQVFHSSHCSVAKPVASVITEQSQWLAITADDGLLRDRADTSANPRYQSLAEDSLLVLVAAGRKPSAGFDISIDTANWTLEGNTLLLQTEQISPAPDSMQASVITSPCVVIAIRGYQGLERLEFVGFGDEPGIQLTTGS